MRRLIVISGAGLSAESGVRTFRTDTESGKALWDEYDLEEVCDIHAFNGNFYHKTHRFYNKRRQELATVEPNPAHLQIGKWYKEFPGQVVNLTTNVDDLIERAGVPREDVLHVHGYLPEIVVKDAFTQQKTIIDVGYSEIEPEDFDWVKPNVIFFGETAPLYNDMYNLFDSITSQDLIVIVGCSNVVIDFKSLLFTPVAWAGAKLAFVNLYDAKAAQEAEYSWMVYSRSDMRQMDEMGIPHWDDGAVNAFTDNRFINMVESHLNGTTSLSSLK